ncbi:MAG: hybrid sensor histidine kinase/response regulator [Desulfarculaceae bacterium]|nr:hybrid sensor histidine kinase/response regulator [Desulfarculaceae bacterium]MCF8046164.1 hybrid sensor histidine kinase/response regulator [Desulfarculaceae bacterium]MCF8097966.1 hybrid sensor histidine kinase/response regulator [Desulfarculaceae bacterium]MCF8123987.1 hybrid sensor histidine kinase/response regulator [Desulfarculaceae bacterium]
MSSSDDFRRQLMETFQVELMEHLGTLTDGCLALERQPQDEDRQRIIEEMFRAAHSLKGAARAVELEDLGLLAHRMEDVFSAIRKGKVAFSSELGDLFLHALDSISHASRMHQEGTPVPGVQQRPLLEQLEAAAKGEPFEVPSAPSASQGREQAPPASGAVEEKPAACAPEFDASAPAQGQGPAQKPEAGEQSRGIASQGQNTIRVSLNKLDSLMEGMVELLVARMRPAHRLNELNQMRRRLGTWETHWRQVRGNYNQLLRRKTSDPHLLALLDYVGRSEENLRALIEAATHMAGGMASDTRQLGLLTDDMQMNVHRVRMLPLTNLFSLFPRMVRDLARQSGKLVDLELQGEHTEVDRQVLEAMKDPLTHLLRNALDHGIEPPEIRSRQGKPATGRIVLRASQEGDMVLLEVRDDGAGIDLDKVREAACSRGLLDPDQAQDLNADDCRELLFHSGFSTKDKVNQLSGRGVGLDAVRAGVENLQGLVKIDSTPGRGTTFSLMLPLTLATTKTLLLKVGATTVAVPASSVERIHMIPVDRVGSVEGKSVIELDGRTVPLVSMARVLELSSETAAESKDKIIAVAMGLAERRAAFAVDGLRGTQEVVVKSLGQQLKKVRNVAGAAVLGSGEVIVVLNVADLLASAARGASVTTKIAAKVDKKAAPLILVVDDSITTRTLEKNILETAGYRVQVASDGEEAWDMVQRRRYNIVVSDVDMPRLDGCGLATRVKRDERFRDIPVVLVTSLDSEEDKLRGMQSGADAYITKGEFDQGHLLGTIERLIG